MLDPFYSLRSLRSLFIAAVTLSALLLASASFAAAQQPFTAKAFADAQARGDTVLVEIHADWCPTCKAQLPILNKLSSEPAFSKVVRLRVDFDDQKTVVKQFGARMQSTLIVFQGKKEIQRSVGVTDEKAIRALVAAGVHKT